DADFLQVVDGAWVHVVKDPQVIARAIFRFASRLDLGEEITVLLQMLFQPPFAHTHERAAEALSHDGQQLAHLALAALEILNLTDLDLSLRELRFNDARQGIGWRAGLRSPFRIESEREPLASAQFNRERFGLLAQTGGAALRVSRQRRKSVRERIL